MMALSKTKAWGQDGKPVSKTSRLRRGVEALLITLLLISLLTLTIEAKADSHQMSLTHHEFEDWDFAPQANDEIVIKNRSDISHSIYVTYPDGTVTNLGVQLPGESVTWQAPESGEYLFQCWIHPIIRARMTVQ